MELIPEEEYKNILEQNPDQAPETIPRYRKKITKPEEKVIEKPKADPRLIEWFKEKMEMMTTYDDEQHWIPKLE